MNYVAPRARIKPKSIDTLVAQMGLVSIRQGRAENRGLGGQIDTYKIWRSELLRRCNRSLP